MEENTHNAVSLTPSDETRVLPLYELSLALVKVAPSTNVLMAE